MKFTIGKTEIGDGHPTYIIAELSANHGGSKDKAMKLIQEAQKTGANAVKFQTYRADTITLDSNKEDFVIPPHDPWHYKGNLFNLYQEAYTPWDWHADMFAEARRLGMDVFSSPFDLTSVDFLENLNCDAYKIASPEIVDIPLIAKCARTGKPVIISTGFAELQDIELAVQTLKENGCPNYVLLKCTAEYPAPPETMNLRTIPDMANRFGCIAGLSDHTLGIGVPVASVALGGQVIEKHFMLEGEESVDSFFSLNERTFKELVDEVRKVEKALGIVTYDVLGDKSKKFRARRSLYISNPIKKGETFTAENVKSVRPSWGLHPKYYEAVLGKKAMQDLEKGDRLALSHVEGLSA
jgi:pseudaminic acid synthase